MLVATYDYWGYYNVCFLGDEVREPGRTIPRAVMLSIAGSGGHLPGDEHQRARGYSVA